jgi:hypothetical protein
LALVLGAVVSVDSREELSARAAALREVHEARARAELAEADRACPGCDAVPGAGDVLAEVLLLKGLPGPAEAAGGDALSGVDGEAASKALEALGWDASQAFRALTCPQPGLDRTRCARRVRIMVEAVDPRVVVALDGQAAEDLARAFEVAPLRPGAEVVAAGRRLVAVSGLEESLDDPARKKVVWREFKAAAPGGPSY